MHQLWNTYLAAIFHNWGNKFENPLLASTFGAKKVFSVLATSQCVCKECERKRYWFPPPGETLCINLDNQLYASTFMHQLCVLGARKRTWSPQGGGNLDNQLCASTLCIIFPLLCIALVCVQRACAWMCLELVPTPGGTLASGWSWTTNCYLPVLELLGLETTTGRSCQSATASREIHI